MAERVVARQQSCLRLNGLGGTVTQTLLILIAATALLVSFASLLVAFGTARRVNKRGTLPAFPMPVTLPSGVRLPETVMDAFETLPSERQWLLVAATSTCPACKGLAESMNQNRSAFENAPVVIVDGGKAEDAKFEQMLDFPVRTIGDESGELRRSLKVNIVPHSFVMKGDRIEDQSLGDDIASLLTKMRQPTVASS
jgi:hypothetical protein